MYFLNETHAMPLRHGQWLCESQKRHGHLIRSDMPTPTPKTINSMFSWQAVRVIHYAGCCFERGLCSLALPPAQILRRTALYALLFILEHSEQPRSEHFSLGHTQRVHFALALFLATKVIIETTDSLQPYFDALETLALNKVSVFNARRLGQ
jgi:hypothetical protein